MKLFVEMDDEQYEKYKSAIEGKIDLNKIQLENILESNGYKKEFSAITPDSREHCNVSIVDYVKGNERITIESRFDIKFDIRR